eukprot:5725-Heterococcus_DN1.PRE.4
MLPTAKLASMTEEPSRGSNPTEYPCDECAMVLTSPPMSSSCGFSSDAATATLPHLRKLSKMTLLKYASIAFSNKSQHTMLYISVVIDGACLGITIRCPDQMKQKSSVET